MDRGQTPSFPPLDMQMQAARAGWHRDPTQPGPVSFPQCTASMHTAAPRTSPPDTRPHARTLHWLLVSPSVHAFLQTYIHSLVCKHPCLFAHSRRHPRARARTLTLVFHTICTLTLSTQPSQGRFLCMHLQGHRQCPPAWPDTSGRDFSQSIFPSPSPLPWSCGGCICAVSHA